MAGCSYITVWQLRDKIILAIRVNCPQLSLIIFHTDLSYTRDIDLVVESRAMEYQDKRRILYSLAHVLRKANITSNVQVIAKAKVPIVKFVTNLG